MHLVCDNWIKTIFCSQKGGIGPWITQWRRANQKFGDIWNESDGRLEVNAPVAIEEGGERKSLEEATSPHNRRVRMSDAWRSVATLMIRHLATASLFSEAAGGLFWSSDVLLSLISVTRILSNEYYTIRLVAFGATERCILLLEHQIFLLEMNHLLFFANPVVAISADTPH